MTSLLNCILAVLCICSVITGPALAHTTAAPPTSSKKIVCYFPMGLSSYHTPLPPGLDPTLCTHIILIGSSIIEGRITPAKAIDPEIYYKKIPLMKKLNPQLKVLLCNGGDFNGVLATPLNRTRYVNSSVPILRKYGFDGLDIDFEFPAWNGLPKSQKHSFTQLLMELFELFTKEAALTKRPQLMLTAAVAATKEITDASYEVPALAKVLDFINLMCYDYHGFAYYDPFTGFNSPLYPESYDYIYGNRSIVFSAQYWQLKGMPQSKVVVGIPVYGHSYKLVSKYLHGVHALSYGHGPNGGYVSYPQACKYLQSNFTRVWSQECQVPYMYKDDLWISYEDPRSIQLKVDWIKKNGYPGVMVYALNYDDYEGTCDGGHTKSPLLKIINKFRY
ncbi:acidic mammalian chitinase-like isoform X1 [Argonauta hians]